MYADATDEAFISLRHYLKIVIVILIMKGVLFILLYDYASSMLVINGGSILRETKGYSPRKMSV